VYIPAGLPTLCQPALELFERPLLHFSHLICRLRGSPASLVRTLQRSFRDEVALISRVFSTRDRSPLPDAILLSAISEPKSETWRSHGLRKTSPLAALSSHRDEWSAPFTEVSDASGVKRGAHLSHLAVLPMSPFFRCGIADPHGVYDVKDQFGLIAEAISPCPISRRKL
jgi:hypothetical protein